jgi:3-(3-hydroxy-phenyl)propionate hydroxylase
VSGLRDALNLSWKIAAVVQGSASHAILDSYDTERRPHARATVDLARLLGQMIMPSSLGVSFVVHGLVRLLDAFPPTRPMFRELEIKPRTRFARGLFKRRAGGERLGAGAVFPQAVVRDRGQLVLSDEVLGVGFCLVGFGVDPADLLPAALRDAWTALGGRFVQICHRSQALNLGARSRRCEDVSGAFLSKAQAIGWAAVVRPDRTILCEGPVQDAARLVTTALALLDAPPERRSCETRPAMDTIEGVLR